MKRALTILLLIVLSLQGYSQNWSQYLGPNRNSTIYNVEIASEWPEKGPRKLWEIPLGKGYGGASIHNGEVFILDRPDTLVDALRCLDLKTGKEKWRFEYDAVGELPYPGSRAVPTVDDAYVWMVGPHGHLHCVDRKTHKELWSVNINEKYEVEPAHWGIAQSPVVYKDMVIVAPMGKKAGVVAFDKVTGEVKWESRPLTGRTFYSSLTLVNLFGTDQVIALSPYDKKDSTKMQEIVGFDVENGIDHWTFTDFRTFGNITPVTVIDSQRIFITDCSYNDKYKPASIMLHVDYLGAGVMADSLFLSQEAGCKMHPAVVYKDHIYLNNNGKKGQMACLNMEGKNVWADLDSVPKFGMGGYILLGDYILNQNGKNGDIHLIKPSPHEYIELGKASFFNNDKSQAWAPPAFADGKLLIRDTEKMVCIDLVNP